MHSAAQRYRLGIERELTARHFLTVPDAGPEGELHAHHYGVEIVLEGAELDEYGYLVDIDRLEVLLDETLERFSGAILNDLAEFGGDNPSVERFARVIGDAVAGTLDAPHLDLLTVRLWEDDVAWASHQRPLADSR